MNFRPQFLNQSCNCFRARMAYVQDRATSRLNGYTGAARQRRNVRIAVRTDEPTRHHARSPGLGDFLWRCHLASGPRHEAAT